MAPATKKQILNRLHTAHGHLQGVKKMGREGTPCPQIAYQLRAITGAPARIEEHVIEEHVRLCLGRAGLGHIDEVIDEIFKLWSYSPAPRKRASQGGDASS